VSVWWKRVLNLVNMRIPSAVSVEIVFVRYKDGMAVKTLTVTGNDSKVSAYDAATVTHLDLSRCSLDRRAALLFAIWGSQ